MLVALNLVVFMQMEEGWKEKQLFCVVRNGGA
jgi:hypothetical protein